MTIEFAVVLNAVCSAFFMILIAFGIGYTAGVVAAEKKKGDEWSDRDRDSADWWKNGKPKDGDGREEC